MKYVSIVIFLFVIPDLVGQEVVDYEIIEINCLNLANNEENEFVINSRKEYFTQMKSLRLKKIECRNLGFPSIDFETYTLIGYIIKTGGCEEPKYNLQILSDESTYYVKCEVSDTGACRRQWTKAFWVIVNKLDETKEVKFAHGSKL